MPIKPSAIPTGYGAVVPYLRVKGAAEALAFYKKAFGAKERFHLMMGDRVGHAEIEIDGTVIMFSDEFPEMGVLGPKSIKATTVTMAIMVEDCDAAVKKEVAAGAKLKRPPQNEFYGDRSASIEDPFGHEWMLQQHLEDVSPREMQKRLDAMMASMGSAPAQKTTKAPKRKG
jgi:PhnB protein